METETTTEFAVNLTCSKCVKSIENILKEIPEISKFEVELNNQVVIISSTKPVNELKNLLESTGKRAVIVGTGSSKIKSKYFASEKSAVVMLGGLIGYGDIEGVVRFIQIDHENCIIDGTIDGLIPLRKHSLAIHECGDISGGCESIGKRYSPKNELHDNPGSNKQHIGYLGNIEADEQGRAQFKFSDKLVKVCDVIGRSFAIAEELDDHGVEQHLQSKVSKNREKILSCGIIARSAGLFENAKRICACDGVTLWDERNRPIAGPSRSSINNTASTASMSKTHESYNTVFSNCNIM